MERFQREDGPPFLVLSLKAGGTGLNLTAASHVIHFDRWWNPAVEDQATDRAYRIGQQRNVLVHKFVCQGTVEEKIDGLLEAKRGMSDEVLGGGGRGGPHRDGRRGVDAVRRDRYKKGGAGELSAARSGEEVDGPGMKKRRERRWSFWAPTCPCGSAGSRRRRRPAS